MSKKNLIALLVLLLGTSLYSQASKMYHFYTEIFLEEELFITPDKIYRIEYKGGDSYEYSIIPQTLFSVKENGYIYYKDDITLLDNEFDALMISTERKRYQELLDWFNLLNTVPGNNYSVENEYLRCYRTNRSFEGKKIYKASSRFSERLKEGTVVYDVDNLWKFAFNKQEQVDDPYLNFKHIPWVEGVDGYGIGETIEISSETEFSSVVILNGYVDFDRLNLYKDNSRVKRFKVIDLDNKKEYFVSLDDEVKYQFAYLETPTKNVCFIIDDVYKGEKWADTCISGLIPCYYKMDAKFCDFKNQNQDRTLYLTDKLEKKLKECKPKK